MKFEYNINITIEVDMKKLKMLHGENYLKYIKESSDEFAEQLTKFMNNHPFVKACELEEVESNK